MKKKVAIAAMAIVLTGSGAAFAGGTGGMVTIITGRPAMEGTDRSSAGAGRMDGVSTAGGLRTEGRRAAGLITPPRRSGMPPGNWRSSAAKYIWR